MKMVYGAIASLVVFIAAVNLLHFVYIKYYFSDPGSFRLATIVIIVACAAWYYFRVPSFMDNYRVWKERRNSSEL
jgi:membrane protein YdbS with pleckstrin-like domain